MKPFLLFTLLCCCLGGSAQWSNATNQFYDSLDMPVAQAAYDQVNPIIVKSESDDSYFVIWQDFRNGTGNSNADIYAQKYDKDGKALWAQNGVPVATGSSYQIYNNIPGAIGNNSTADYRNVSHAASDGAGGFYIAWENYTSYYGVYVQHIKSNGSRVYAEDGYPIAAGDAAHQISYAQPQLVTDGKGGFFIGYTQTPQQGGLYVMVYGYREEGGALVQYGGGQMNYCARQIGTGVCGDPAIVEFNSVWATSFFIFPDLQNGCGVVMGEMLNSEKNIVGFNWLARVTKDCHTIVNTAGRGDLGGGANVRTDYKKDSVVIVYKLATSSITIECGGSSPCPTPGGCIILQSNNFLDRQGVLPLSLPHYGLTDVSATMLTTDGNIDVCLVTWNQRDYINNAVTNIATQSYTMAIPHSDSVPDQLCSTSQPVYTQPYPPRADKFDKLNEGSVDVDTLIAGNPSYFYNYSIASSGNRIFLAAQMQSGQQHVGAVYQFPVYYQELKLNRTGDHSFALNINTASNNGVLIGQGKDGTYPSLSSPVVTGDGKGNALFYAGTLQRCIQVSPVGQGGDMLWGAMGLPISSGNWKRSNTNPDAPFAYMDQDGKAVIAWQDTRQLPDGTYSSNNIYMRHLDSLALPLYQPPLLKPQLLPPSYNGSSAADPQFLAGSSNAWTTFQAPLISPNSSPYTPVAQIKDDYNLGNVTINTYQYAGAVRTTNGKPYLNRNYTITVTNHPANATIYVRFIFTTAEFKALQAADPSIQDPGNLSVIKQISNGTVPAAYTPVAGEQGLPVLSWAAIDTSGYYIEIAISDFSDFFITSGSSALPITLVGFTATRIGKTTLLEWQTASETNNSHFNILRSPDGSNFTPIGRVTGHGTSSVPQAYSFTDTTPLSGNNYYRLSQVDLDGKATLSPIRVVSFGNDPGRLEVYPNPVYTLLHVRLPRKAVIAGNIDVYDISGRKVLQQHVAPGVPVLDTDFSTLLPGTYLLYYEKENIKVVKR